MEIVRFQPIQPPDRPGRPLPTGAPEPSALTLPPQESVVLLGAPLAPAPVAPSPLTRVEEAPVAPRPIETPPIPVSPGPGLQVMANGRGGAPGVIAVELEAPPVAPTHILGTVKGLSLADAAYQAQMRQREELYLNRYPYQSEPGPESLRQHRDLLHRYADSRVQPDRLHQVCDLFAQERGVDISTVPPSLHDTALDSGTAPTMKAALHRLADGFFASPRASQNPEKCRLIKAETDRYVDLLLQAQAEESGRAAPSGDEVYRLLAGNVGILAWQDRAASELAIGDHGVRHLVGHNIRVCETMADEVERNGGKVTARDRLVLHQAMILHDLGYSTPNVRGSMQREGVVDQDMGHPVLSARYLRERSESPEDPLRRLFSAEDLEAMHRCVLYHDMDQFGKSGLSFQLTPQPTREQRSTNLESLTRVADNTHAFDDKLPEMLYRNPRSMVMMRLIKTAAELGENVTVGRLKSDLKAQIQQRQDLSADDQAAMGRAVDTMSVRDVTYSARRILGNEPQYAVGPDGKVLLTVQESAIHKDVAQLVGEDRYRLLRSWIQDISGAHLSQINPQQSRLDTDTVTFRVSLGGERARQATPFQRQLAEVFVQDEPFRRWAVGDMGLSKTQGALQELLKAAPSLPLESLRQAATTYLDGGEQLSAAEIQAALQGRLGAVASQRHDLLHTYLDQHPS